PHGLLHRGRAPVQREHADARGRGADRARRGIDRASSRARQARARARPRRAPARPGDRVLPIGDQLHPLPVEEREASGRARAVPGAERPHPRHLDLARVRRVPAGLDRNTGGERPVHRRARHRLRRPRRTPIAGPTLLVDAASLAYRAYHAVPEWKASDGTNVNAALGFLNLISRLLPDRRPTKLVVALDADWRPQFRLDAMPSYKSHRVAGPDDPPDPVDPQMKIIVELL